MASSRQSGDGLWSKEPAIPGQRGRRLFIRKLRPGYQAFCTVFDCHHAESRSGTTILWFFCEPAFLVLASLAEAPRARPQKPIRTDRIPRGFDIGGVVTCRDCEKISQAPAPSCNCQGWAGPSLLAMILFEKCGHHQPLNRQSKRYAREGVPLGPVDPGRSSGWLLRSAGTPPQAGGATRFRG